MHCSLLCCANLGKTLIRRLPWFLLTPGRADRHQLQFPRTSARLCQHTIIQRRWYRLVTLWMFLAVSPMTVATAFCGARHERLSGESRYIKIKIDSRRFELLHAFNTEKSSNKPLSSPLFLIMSNIPQYFWCSPLTWCVAVSNKLTAWVSTLSIKRPGNVDNVHVPCTLQCGSVGLEDEVEQGGNMQTCCLSSCFGLDTSFLLHLLHYPLGRCWRRAVLVVNNT